MTVLRIAHRAGNELSLIAPALAAGADLIEADVKLRHGRLEVRHARSMGPLPWHWEPFYLVPRGTLYLHELTARLPAGSQVMLDLKGWQPWLGRQVHEAMTEASPGTPYTVCSRRWSMLEVFADLPHVRVVHSVRTRRELARLRRHLRTERTWGVSIHRDLLAAPVVAWLREHAEVVMTWPIDDVATLDHVVSLGVNAVISNDLDAIAGR